MSLIISIIISFFVSISAYLCQKIGNIKDLALDWRLIDYAIHRFVFQYNFRLMSCPLRR